MLQYHNHVYFGRADPNFSFRVSSQHYIFVFATDEVIKQSSLQRRATLSHAIRNAVNPTDVALNSVQMAVEFFCDVLEVFIILLCVSL